LRDREDEKVNEK